MENAALMSCVSGGEMRLISVCLYKVLVNWSMCSDLSLLPVCSVFDLLMSG